MSSWIAQIPCVLKHLHKLERNRSPTRNNQPLLLVVSLLLQMLLLRVLHNGLSTLSLNVLQLWLDKPHHHLQAEAQVRVLEQARVQALVVLGGGVEVDLPDGVAQLGRHSLDRLRQGVQWARVTQLPLMFTGGVGWGGRRDGPTEAEVAQRVAQDAFGWPLRWTESQSRDTQENAQQSFRILSAQGITRIGLVTDSWHMGAQCASV